AIPIARLVHPTELSDVVVCGAEEPSHLHLFAEADEVWWVCEPKLLVRPQSSALSHPGLHLVQDKGGAGLPGKLLHFLEEGGARVPVTSLALDGLDEDRRHPPLVRIQDGGQGAQGLLLCAGVLFGELLEGEAVRGEG